MKTISSILSACASAIMLLACSGSLVAAGSGSGSASSSGASGTSSSASSSTSASSVERTQKSPEVNRSRGGETSATRTGREAHKSFEKQFGERNSRRAEPRSSSLSDKKEFRPDIVTKKNRPVELKPDTPSGRRKMNQQLTRYENTLDRRGIRSFYDTQGRFRFERTPYREWRSRVKILP